MNYINTPCTFFNYCIVHSLLGIISGVFIEKLASYIKQVIDNVLFVVMFQIIFTIIMLYIFEKYICNTFAIQWTQVTPGIFYMAFLFNMQTSLYPNLWMLIGQL